MITQEYLKSRLIYNSDTGVFIWLKNKSNNVKIGSVAGGKAAMGYSRIMIDGSNYKSHRLAWLYCNGNLPNMIDHMDGNRSNNAIENLRDVSSIENSRNMKMYSTNSSGVVGVRLDKKSNKWHARINVKSKLIHLGYFFEKESAIIARVEAEIKYGFHENHGRLK